jgi:hypothetical protein
MSNTFHFEKILSASSEKWVGPDQSGELTSYSLILRTLRDVKIISPAKWLRFFCSEKQLKKRTPQDIHGFETHLLEIKHVNVLERVCVALRTISELTSQDWCAT